MDYSESTKVVFQRIEKLEPENVSKIIGYLLLKDHGELEMIRLAFGPDHILENLIEKVKRELGLSPKPAISVHVSSPQAKKSLVSNLPTKFTPFTPASSHAASSSAADNGLWIPEVPAGQPIIHNLQHFPVVYLHPAAGGYSLQNQPQFLPFEHHLGSYNLAGPFYPAPNYCQQLSINQIPDQSSLSLPEFCPHFPELSMQVCDSFRKGYCKYGGSCRFLHICRLENGHFMVLNPQSADDMVISDYLLSHGSLKQLEMELTELLESRRGIPVSVSSLPILYFDKFGRALQVEGYLLENHKQAKFSCRMTQLLAQMTNCIHLIDRPHGRQSIILAEDIDKYMKFNEEGNGQELQVYLTFPPQSMCTEQDVHTYFNNFGPVQEVRIPSQVKRMFGFVTFVYPETAALVLTKTNPHYICGSQVLVKPYRLKPMLVDRKTEAKVPHQIDLDPHFPDAESELPSTPRLCENMDLLETQINEQYEESVELSSETKATNHSFVGQKSDGSRPPNDQAETLNGSEGVPSSNFTSEVKVNRTKTFYNASESSGRPDSPSAHMKLLMASRQPYSAQRADGLGR